MDEEIIKTKCIRSYSFKTKTVGGYLAKTYVSIYADGVTTVCQLILCKETLIPTYTKECTKFGQSLFTKAIAFKYDSLMTIAMETSKCMKDFKINRKDIV